MTKVLKMALLNEYSLAKANCPSILQNFLSNGIRKQSDKPHQVVFFAK